LTPEQVDRLVIEIPVFEEQVRISKEIRALEHRYMDKLNEAETLLKQAKEIM